MDDSLQIALEAIEGRLRRHSDEPVKTPIAVLIHLQMGYTRREIEQRLKISRAQYAAAWERLHECVMPGADSG